MTSFESLINIFAATNIKIQKAVIIVLSISTFIVTYTINLNEIPSVNLIIPKFVSDFSMEYARRTVRDNQIYLLPLAIQYCTIFLILSYTFNYTFASFTYFTKYNRSKILWSLGTFVIGKIILEYVIPIGIAFYSLYVMNKSCHGCLINNANAVTDDFAQFTKWLQLYLAQVAQLVKKILSSLLSVSIFVIKPLLEIILIALEHVSNVIRQFIHDNP